MSKHFPMQGDLTVMFHFLELAREEGIEPSDSWFFRPVNHLEFPHYVRLGAPTPDSTLINCLAEGIGFEPMWDFTPASLSKRAHLASLATFQVSDYSIHIVRSFHVDDMDKSYVPTALNSHSSDDLLSLG